MTRADKAAALAIASVAVISHIAFGAAVSDVGAKSAVISVDGKEYAVYRLRDFSKPERVVIDTEFGHNTLEISASGVKMLEADCPDKTDVKCGMITKPNQMLICAPNRVTVRLVGENSDTIDGVTY